MLNKLECTSNGGNTGTGDCFLDIRSIGMAILVPNDRAYTPAETATASLLLAALATDTMAIAKNRVYPIGDFQVFTDNSEAPTLETFGRTGGVAMVREGKYNWTNQFIKGGFCLNKALRKFNKRSLSVLFIDDAGLLIGRKDGVNLKGIPLDFLYTAPPKINSGAATTIYTIQMVFNSTYLADSIGFVQGNLADWLSLEGLQDVSLTATKAANVLIVKGFVGCDKQNIFESFGTELSVVGAWVAKNATTGNVVTITSVTGNAGDNSFTITLDASDTDYVATANGILINLASAMVLNGLLVSGYEGIPASV